ncbi:hypothetical protein [Xylanimonas protaetiae]|uniref:Uncharacterized protein n=1 Tax=Xylanimonas protaetiae TaxID=2509457 RepID=A0A4P6FDC7_9MICO|nr:hypothetical protein [Xylanimonas protaetiae]QAY71617.1 hypothetical protein ET471_17560 [Xylanimonas protaetiae]
MIKVGYTRSVEERYEALVFQDDASGETLEFRRALVVTAWASSGGSYVIVRDGVVHDGGLTGFALSGVVLRLVLDEEAADALDLPTEVELRLSAAGAATVAELLPGIVE